MCDTLYCSPGRPAHDAAAFQPSFFGKNSDRTPSEPQALCLVRGRGESAVTHIGGIEYAIKDSGFSFALSKPSWMRGGEMGFNERGVAIGNEAVFSRFKPAANGVLGMDILRAALSVAATAKEAVDFICCFVEAHAQGGNGAYRGRLVYNNSFLISDPLEAYIVETAGNRWAWRAISGRDAISNSYCITDDYKRVDTQTRKEIAPVNERAACSDEADPGRKGRKESFKAHVESAFYLRFTKGERRRALSLSLMEDLEGRMNILNFLGVLRAHGPYDPLRRHGKHMEGLCVHAGGIPASATTASFAAEYREDASAVLWFSGTPYPCVSLYKPLLLFKGQFFPLWMDYSYDEDAEKAYSYWEMWRRWLGAPGNSASSADSKFAGRRDRAQQSLVMMAERAFSALVSSDGAADLSLFRRETGEIIASWEKDCGL